VIRRYLGLLALLAAFRAVGRLARLAAVALVVVAAAPVSLVAAGAVTLAWLRGWAPRRLYRAALWCLPMVAVWLAAIAVTTRSWWQVAAAPQEAWLTAWHQAAAGSLALAAATIAPAAIPVGLAVGGLAWSRRIYSMETHAGGLFPTAPATFQARQWRRQVRTAKARIAAPGSVPLLWHNGAVVAGAVIRAVGHPGRDLAMIPYQRLRSHQVIIGTTGTGKTTLLLRLWAGFLARGLQLHAAGTGQRPLLVVLDCKGGADSRRIADRVRRVLRDAGARSTAVWPDEASLSLWDLPPGQLTSTLIDMIEHGTGAAAYYTDVMEAIVTLAVGAPAGPPAGAADFLSRLDIGWLGMAYSGAGHEEDLALLRSAARHITDISLRYRTLLRRLGGGLDGAGSFADADAWYCILEGTADVPVAEAQARALVDLLAHHAAHGPGREILLAVDEFSAVSRRLPIWQLYERARSLGLAVQVSAQSWQGLAPDDDDRYRIATTADGGIWLLRTPHPEPVTALAGNRPGMDTSRRLLGNPRWSHEGSSRPRETPVADPTLIRTLGVGQTGYIYRGGVTYIQVKRLLATPAALAQPPTAARQFPGVQEPAAHEAGTGADSEPPAVAEKAVTSREPLRTGSPPDVAAFLDDAFGTEPG
jgi:Type IV secretion-system coupling protein DNA-binding domain